jgi:hypothetical protein
MIYHNPKFRKRWQKLNFFEQMANIGSEVERAVLWREKDKEYSKLALYRALELLDLQVLKIRRIKKDSKNFYASENVWLIISFLTIFINLQTKNGATIFMPSIMQ